jgi:hypothetical protein
MWGTKNPVREPLSTPGPGEEERNRRSESLLRGLLTPRPRRDALGREGQLLRLVVHVGAHSERGVGVPEPRRDDRHRHVVLGTATAQLLELAALATSGWACGRAHLRRPVGRGAGFGGRGSRARTGPTPPDPSRSPPDGLGERIEGARGPPRRRRGGAEAPAGPVARSQMTESRDAFLYQMEQARWLLIRDILDQFVRRGHVLCVDGPEFQREFVVF